MQGSNQALGEFVVLLLTGLLVSAICAVLIADYKGALSRYVRHLGRLAEGIERKRFVLIRSQYADPPRMRLGIRLACIGGLALGVFVLIFEIVALAGGNVR